MQKKTVEREASLEVTTYAVAIRNALRRCGFYLRAQRIDRAIGLMLPPDADVETYRQAAKAVLRQSHELIHYTVTTIELGRKGETYSEDARKVLAQNLAVVVLIEKGAKLPPEVAIALDRILDVGSVKPIHLMSATKSAWQIDIASDVATQLCEYPPNLLFQALRKGRPIEIVLTRLTDASKVPQVPAWEPRVEELEGYGAAREWALSLAVDLDEWRAGKLAWRDVDAGLLISGPPGTGKTLFASAVARSCRASFFGTSSARWQSKGHLGDMLGAMHKSFREAADNAPAVLFLDEIDSIGDRRTFRGDNANYSMQVVNALLELLDGSGGREGVVVIAASNFPNNIDAALLRPGRLDRHIAIGLPDHAARAQMLSMHLENVLPPEDLQEVARATSGYTGATIAQVAKDARRTARRQGREVSVPDLLALVPPVAVLGRDERWAACAHEAGHALVGLELAVAEIEMIVVAKEMGHRHGRIGYVQWRRQTTRRRSRQSYLDEIAMMLGGMAAEKVVLGDVLEGSGGVDGSDLQRASDLATLMLASLGLGSLLYCDVSTSKDLDELRRQNPVLRRQVERLLAKQLERAEEIIQARMKDVKTLAGLLMDRDFIPGREVSRLVNGSSGDQTAS
ncbi:MAG TPA: AAA family ATPase [Rhizobium sp.]|nr:AAA family ATPase [Rhizobium sp.]